MYNCLSNVLWRRNFVLLFISLGQIPVLLLYPSQNFTFQTIVSCVDNFKIGSFNHRYHVYHRILISFFLFIIHLIIGIYFEQSMRNRLFFDTHSYSFWIQASVKEKWFKIIRELVSIPGKTWNLRKQGELWPMNRTMKDAFNCWF